MNSILNSVRKVKNFFDKSIETIITFVKIIIENNYWAKSEKLSPDQNYVVLVNGPSLKIDLTKLTQHLKKCKLIVVNQFCTTTEFLELKPSYYFLVDQHYFVAPLSNEINNKNSNSLLKKVDWKMTLYVPYRYRNSEYVKLVSQNKNITFNYFNSTNTKGGFKKLNNFLYNKGLCSPQAQNVLVLSLFHLVNVGCKNIFFFGAQNDWHINSIVDKNNRVQLTDKHFYGTKTITLKNPKGGDLKFHELLSSSVKALKGYYPVKAYAEYKDCEIYNCSKKSFVDAFPRLSDEKFIEKLNS